MFRKFLCLLGFHPYKVFQYRPTRGQMIMSYHCPCCGKEPT